MSRISLRQVGPGPDLPGLPWLFPWQFASQLSGYTVYLSPTYHKYNVG